MDNKNTIKRFYTCFQQKDWKGIQACYHPEIQFSDPVFPNLKGKEAKAMWHMLVTAATDLEINYSGVEASEISGHCKWEAQYSFLRTGRKVHNRIQANFKFVNGLIIHHQDTFDIWKWSQMALGTIGLLLGWSSFMRRKIRVMAGQNLSKFIAENPRYQ